MSTGLRPEESTLSEQLRLGGLPRRLDPHPWRAAALLTLAAVVLSMLCSFVIEPVFSSGAWFSPSDVWEPFQAAQYVASGALGYVYQSNRWFVDLPMLPIVLAPVALIQGWTGLTQPMPFPLPHPTIWLVYCPYAIAVSSLPLLYAVRALAVALGARRRLLLLQVAALGVVIFPTATIWGHYEDVFAIALLLLAVRRLMRGEVLQAALMLGLAVAFKQWAVLAVPLLIGSAPRGQRVRFTFVAALLPGLLAAFTLAVDWPAASRALLHAQSFPPKGHRALWIAPSARHATATVPRIVDVLFAIGLGWFLRRAGDPIRLVAGLAWVLLARLLFEPVLLSYYLAPALALLLVLDVTHTGRGTWTALFGGFLYCFFLLWYGHLIAWWVVSVGLWLVLITPAVSILRGRGWPAGNRWWWPATVHLATSTAEEPTPDGLPVPEAVTAGVSGG